MYRFVPVISGLIEMANKAMIAFIYFVKRKIVGKFIKWDVLDSNQ